MDMSMATLLISFTAGLVSFISPCVLPLIPSFISLISGISSDTLQNSSSASKKVLIRTLHFVFGFSFIFIVLGMSASQLGNLLGQSKDILRYLGGSIVILLGLHMCKVLNFKFLYRQFSFTRKENSPPILTNISVFFTGAAFALGWTPCIGPILTSILIVASTQGKALDGFFLLLFYSLGFGIPFIITALFINKFLSAFNIIKKYYLAIEIGSGILLIVTGILLITNSFSKIASFIIS